MRLSPSIITRGLSLIFCLQFIKNLLQKMQKIFHQNLNLKIPLNKNISFKQILIIWHTYTFLDIPEFADFEIPGQFGMYRNMFQIENA
jgi:hypothetical protein